VPLGASAQGFERHFAINYLGHWELTRLLLPALRRAQPARIVNVASAAHALLCPADGVGWAALGAPAAAFPVSYHPWCGYATSKLMLILHAAELTRREGVHGVVAASVHPGSVGGTQLFAHLPVAYGVRLALAPRIWEFILHGPRPVTKNVREGAATPLAVLLAPALPAAGAYYSDCATVPRTDRFVSPVAYDADAAARLWTTTEALVAKALPADAADGPAAADAA